MKRKFKLHKVLEYRERVLDKETAALAELQLQEQRKVAAVQEATALMLAKQAEMAEAAASNDFYMVQLYEKYILTLQKQRAQLIKELNEHRKLVAEQKSKTVVAFKNKRIMDKLEVKHKKAYADYVNKEEQKTLEDIVITRMAGAVIKGEEE